MRKTTFVLAAALFAVAPAARAQSAPLALDGAPSHAFASAPAASAGGPALSSRSAGARPVAATDVRASALEEESSALRRRARFNEAQTLMIVGGAAFIAGALIGDDAGTIVMVGGAAVGLYGLYLYLQQ
jgi:hypothetical protein